MYRTRHSRTGITAFLPQLPAATELFVISLVAHHDPELDPGFPDRWRRGAAGYDEQPERRQDGAPPGETPRASVVEFRFVLPSGETICGKGLTAWGNDDGMIGIKFEFLRGDGASRLQEWLSAHLDVTCRIDARSMPRPAGESREC
jgi:hypothetical protein